MPHYFILCLRMKQKRLSFIVPAFNEAGNIAHVARKINDIAPAYCRDFEIIIVNDGSIDATGKIADHLAKSNKRVQVIHNQQNRGLGYSFFTGVSKARFEQVMLYFGDDDCPTESLKAMLSHLGEADIIIPYYTNFHLTKTWFRHLLSISYTHLINYITGFTIRYYNGMSIHTTKLINQMNYASIGLEFQAESIIYLIKHGATYVEVAVTNQDRKQGASSALRLKSISSVTKFLIQLYLKYKLPQT